MAATLADIQRKYGNDVELIYKDVSYEPYMEAGSGYLGDLLYNKKADKIKCHECDDNAESDWFKKITPSHLKKHHNYKGKQPVMDYKIKFGLGLGTPLCSKGLSKKLSDAQMGNKSNVDRFLKIRHHSEKETEKMRQLRTSKRRASTFSPQVRNMTNTCQAQMQKRFLILSQLVNRAPTANDCRKYDRGLLEYCEKHYGGFNKGKLALGVKTNPPYVWNKYTEEKLIADLRGFVIKKSFLPTPAGNYWKEKWYSEIIKANYQTYRRAFGSWRRAKMMAGLDRLLEQVKEK
jgi:hypothetical protein